MRMLIDILTVFGITQNVGRLCMVQWAFSEYKKDNKGAKPSAAQLSNAYNGLLWNFDAKWFTR